MKGSFSWIKCDDDVFMAQQRVERREEMMNQKTGDMEIKTLREHRSFKFKFQCIIRYPRRSARTRHTEKESHKTLHNISNFEFQFCLFFSRLIVFDFNSSTSSYPARHTHVWWEMMRLSRKRFGYFVISLHTQQRVTIFIQDSVSVKYTEKTTFFSFY